MRSQKAKNQPKEVRQLWQKVNEALSRPPPQEQWYQEEKQQQQHPQQQQQQCRVKK